MRFALTCVTGLLAIVACTPSPRPHPPAGPVASTELHTTEEVRVAERPSALATFVAAVAPSEDGGLCQTSAQSGVGPANARVVLSFAGAGFARRTVSVLLDSTGRPLQYNDMRGDLRRDRTGPSTSIVLDFALGTAQASNESPEKLEIAEGTLAEALTAVNLGIPQHMLDLLERRCRSR